MPRNEYVPFDEAGGLNFGPDESPEVLARMLEIAQEEKPPEVSLQTFAVQCMFKMILIGFIHEGHFDRVAITIARALDLPIPDFNVSPPERPTSWVYFIQAGEGGDIKIGQTRHIEKRIDDIQNGCSKELRLLLAIPGDKDTELALQKEFRAFRVRREWFAPAPELLLRIEALEKTTVHA